MCSMEDTGTGYVISEAELNAFKKDYYCCQGGKYNLDAQASHLAKLADGYRRKYEETADWTNALKAHALYNSVGVRLPEDTIWEEKAFEVQVKFWQDSFNISCERQQTLNRDLREKLEEVRNNVRVDLKKIDKLVEALTMKEQPLLHSDEFHTNIIKLSVSCTNQMLQFAKEIFQICVESAHTTPPCSFCVIAIGSLAKNEATPFSDLEYIFLIERSDEDIVEFFKKLAVTSYFLIGNLRETKLSYMAITELAGWFDDQQKNGFKIDGLSEGAGNIPTGNGQQQDARFIITVEQLLARYKKVLDNPIDAEATRGDFTAMLQYTKQIFAFGTKGDCLLKEFQERKGLCIPNSSRETLNRKMFKADAEKYNFRPGLDLINRGYIVNSKKELYRYPSILLFNISILVNHNREDSWQTLSELHRSEKISTSIHRSLRFLLVCACYFRLSAYLCHDSQDDRLSVLPVEDGPPLTPQPKTERQWSTAGRRWYLPVSLFEQHCTSSVALKDHISKCFSQPIEDILQMEITPSSWLERFIIYHSCNRWSDALKVFYEHVEEQTVLEKPEKAIAELLGTVNENSAKLWRSIKALSYSLVQHRRWEVALKYHNAVQELMIAVPTDEDSRNAQLVVADTLEEAGLCNRHLERYTMAEQCFVSCLKIRECRLDEKDELIAISHFNLANTYQVTRQYEKAEEHNLESLQISYLNASKVVQFDYYGDVVPTNHKSAVFVDLREIPADERLNYINSYSVALARPIWNLGRVYFSLKYYQRSFSYFSKALSALQEMYGSEASHREIASLLFDISCACNALKRHEEAKTYSIRAVNMIVQLFSKSKPQLFTILQSLEAGMSGPGGSERYYSFVVEAFLQLPGYGVPHPQTASVLSAFTANLINESCHQLAEKALDKSLEMYAEASRSDLYKEEVAGVQVLSGRNHRKAVNLEIAEDCYGKALIAFEELSTRSSYLSTAEVHQELGEMYGELGQHEKAVENFTKAKDIYDKHCVDPHYPKHAEVAAQLLAARELGTK